ncbi:MAG: bifunctional UDP-N-acetylglucosamine diphosphorylase/glucosamine-1-phosphate N-acetyltransferase GlmU [Myxococcales bacterium]|nr:bifunctional UDP-N-acetylglucosamine diphosphorylase/glucosamine-1-phosphate N-acetyltransferase GlmU [Myxococcales bacterium]
MSNSRRAVVILAAGQGSRMKSATPKVLHEVLGYPMIGHVLRSATALSPERIVVITGHGRAIVDAWVDQWAAANEGVNVSCVEQVNPRGTGHAVQSALGALKGMDEVVVLYGDVPLLQTETLAALVAARGDQSLSLLAGQLDDPTGYGRVLLDANGHIAAIVEQADTTPEQRRVRLINAGMMVVDGAFLGDALGRIDDNNAQGELYLTDLLAIAAADGNPGAVYVAPDADELQGVNTRAQAALATDFLRKKVLAELMADGVAIEQPAQTWIEVGVQVGRDSTIRGGVELRGTTRIGERVLVERGCVLNGTVVGDDVHLKPYSVATDSVIGDETAVGPFAHLRPGTDLGKKVKVGNFVETKKATLHEGAKASHLSYLGDCDIGAGSNIGAGTITCNYDGVNKHRTVLAAGVFIGSDSQLVAPVNLGEGAYVGAGTTVTTDVPAGALAVSRAPQRNIEGWVAHKKARQAEEKARRKGSN